jgi:nicotinamide-nucleotide amidase
VIVELIAVGSELLRHGKPDTNSEWLIERLLRAGIEVTVRSTIGDDAGRLASVLGDALARADVVLLTGGLGPTEDDRTRQAVARALGAPLERDALRVAQLEKLYERHARGFGEIEARQADRPAGAAWIDNPLGSAPGLLVERERGLLAALPGVPAEMRAMFVADVLPRLRRRAPEGLGRRSLKIVGRTESSIERQLGDLYAWPGVDVTVLSGADGLELHVLARGRDRVAVDARLRQFEREARRRLGSDLFGVDDDRLGPVVGALLLERRRSIATAESCTAGLLGASLTAVPGSSAWYRGGLIVYDDELKQSLAGVSAESLARDGAVSECVARELAAGARDRCGADIGVGITGVAGPGGGSPDKPVGLVHLSIHDGAESLHWELRSIGDRDMIRRRAVLTALDRLRRRLLERT